MRALRQAAGAPRHTPVHPALAATPLEARAAFPGQLVPGRSGPARLLVDHVVRIRGDQTGPACLQQNQRRAPGRADR